MWKRALALLGVAIGSGAFVSLREDELECEEALAHLEDCCDGFPTHEYQCTHGSGCDPTEPDLEIREAACIQDLDCDELTARDMCERVADAGPKVTDTDGGVSRRPNVCP